jgi:3-oxoadipate enol-lactonase
MPFMQVNGIRLHVVVEGSGQPLILLHGLGSSIASLSAEIAYFRSRCQVIVYDARGHGASDRPSEYGMQDHIGDLLGLIDALGIGQCALLGRSMGSYIAQGAACSAPDRFSRLVLVAPRASAREASLLKLRRCFATELQGRDRRQQSRFLLGKMLAPSTPSRKATLLAALSENPAEQLSDAEEAVAMAAAGSFDFRGVLTNVTAPTLVISGRHDLLNPPEDGALIAALIPGARQVILEHSGHLPAIEERKAYLSLVADFLDQTI